MNSAEKAMAFLIAHRLKLVTEPDIELGYNRRHNPFARSDVTQFRPCIDYMMGK